MLMFNNLIAGEWVDGARVARTSTRPTPSDVVGEYARGHARADAEAAIAAAKAAFPAWSRSTPQQRYDILKKARDEILARKDELGRLLVARGGQDARRRHRRSRARRPDLRVLRRRGLRLAGEKLASRASRHRRRDHPRAGRRRRHHHAVEFPDRHPGLEDRAGALPTATPWCSSRPTSCRARAWALVDILAPRRPAQGRAQPRHGPRLGRRPGDARQHPTSTRSRFTGSVATGQQASPRPASRRADEEVPARDGRQEPAGRARRRRSRRSPSNAPPTARSSPPASAAPPPRG